MLTGELVKATITNLDTEDSVEVMFNPTDYTFTKANNWQPSKKKGANVPPLEFNHVSFRGRYLDQRWRMRWRRYKAL